MTVMKRETVDALSVHPGGVYVDVTLGGGGHTEAILEAAPDARVLAFDRDPAALAWARTRLERFGTRLQCIHAAFSEVEARLDEMGFDEVDGVVADLGVSSIQLDDPTRGMSFRAEGPLDMRMDPTRGETAVELIERLDSDELADILFHYGDERRSRRIARCIKQASDAGELVTTLDLRRAVVRAVGPARVGGVDPATRTFQAIRIAVNGELDELNALLVMLNKRVKIGGVASILSFHSLEDRQVKRAFHDRSLWQQLTKKPRTASEEELATNPRARSAKHRAARRIDEADPAYDDTPLSSSRRYLTSIPPPSSSSDGPDDSDDDGFEDELS
ncbi:MAG: 16S rRNA (cytosine(1402)-N(4))-methyltransferase RsmH [Polyangiaceae bacterium]